MKNLFFIAILLFVFEVYAQPSDSLYKANIEELLVIPPKNSMETLLNTEVVTASNTSEKIGESPATTIVINHEQIFERGYRSLIEIFADLPDMDFSMPYGDVTYYKTYWRGNRTDLGSAFLLMLDGVIFNNLYFNESTALAAFPISSVEKIEVVYGPAASTYGANAFMGVINVITQKKDKSEQLSHFRGLIGSTHTGLTWADVQANYQKNKFRISLSARIEKGNVNQLVNNNNFIWLKDDLFKDKRLWGDLINDPTMVAGKFGSPIEHKAIDLRIFFDKLEIGIQHFRTLAGFGLMYSADQLTSNGKWEQPETSAYLRYTTQISSKFSSQTLLRYRQSYLDRTSYDIEGYNINNPDSVPQKIGNTSILPKETIRGVVFNYWDTFNSSISLYQNFEWKISDKINLASGIKYEFKDLQKSYQITSSEYFFPELINKASDILPALPSNFSVPQNRTNWVDKGIYGQLKYDIDSKHIFHLGLRYDHNSAYGSAPTIRASFIKKYQKFIFKAFYGEAFQEPPLRVLYSNWVGSGADPNLSPERSKTAEININFTNNITSHDLSVYFCDIENSIVGLSSGAKNLGKRQILGLSYKLQGQIPVFEKTNYWLNYSTILNEVEQKFDAKGNAIGFGNIGDLAYHKIQGGISSQFTKKLGATLLLRWVSDRNTVASNPVRNIDGFFLADFNAHYKVFRGIALNLKINNIFDAQVFYTGVRSANSGEKEGFWEGRAWYGSQGFFTSKIPQAFRTFSLVLNLDF